MDVAGYLRRSVISRSVVPQVITLFQNFNLPKSCKLCDERISSILKLFDCFLVHLKKGNQEFCATCISLCSVDPSEINISNLDYATLPLLLELEDPTTKRHFDEVICEFLRVSFALHERSYSDQSAVYDPESEWSISKETLLENCARIRAISNSLKEAGLYESMVNDKLESVIRKITERRIALACRSCVKECNIKAVRNWVDTIVSEWLQANGQLKRTELRIVLNRLYVAVLTCLVRERTTHIYETATRFERARNVIREFGDSIAQLETFVERDSATSRDTATDEHFAEEDEIGVLCFLRETYTRLTDALLRGVRENLLNASRTTHEVLAVHVAIVRLLTAVDRAVDERCSEMQRTTEEGSARAQRCASEPRRSAPRFVDTIGQWVAEPIRLYLRMRTDAIRCVIRALRNADATSSRSAIRFAEEDDRTNAAGNERRVSRFETEREKENRQPTQHSSDSESESDEAGDANSDDDTQHESEMETENGAPISAAWLSWQPRRVRFETVAKAYRPSSSALDEPLDGELGQPRPRLSILSKQRSGADMSSTSKRKREARVRKGERENEAARIIGSLVALFGTDEHFVNEYRNVLADSLLAGRTAARLDHTQELDESGEPAAESANEQERALQRERRAIRFLKRRFGAAKLRECDVMLADVAESARLRTRICCDRDSEFQNRISTRIEELVASENQGQPGANDSEFRFEPLVISSAYWPTLKEGRFSLPADYQAVLDEFATCYQLLKPNRNLEWRTQLGTMVIEVECESDGEQDGTTAPHRRRTLRLTVSSAQACLLKAFEQRAEWSVEDLATQFNAPISATRNRLSLFVRHGLIRQVDTRTFRLNAAALSNENDKDTRRRSAAEPRLVRCDEQCEAEGDEEALVNASIDETGVSNETSHLQTEEQLHDTIYGEDDEDEECGGESAVQTNDERNEEALSTAFAYVVGMLRQLNEVTFERIATMLSVFLPHVTARCDTQALKTFLDGKVRSRELVFANGAYRLPS